jgi:hypothetical protein
VDLIWVSTFARLRHEDFERRYLDLSWLLAIVDRDTGLAIGGNGQGHPIF